MEGLWKTRALGGRHACIPSFKMPTMDIATLHHKDAMRDGYWPKMLLFVLDELFYIYSQIKNLWRANEKIVITYEILCLSMNRCTDWWHGFKKTGMPEAVALLNMNDAHLEHLAWAVYDSALLVGPLEIQEIALGVRCWLGYISISTGAAMTWLIAHHTR